MTTATTSIDALLGRLEGVRQHGDSWQARCPAHDDGTASLSICIGDDGRTLMYCHAGCATADVAQKLGLTLKDLMPSTNGNANGKPQIIKTYDYRDENGTLLYQACRMIPKDFLQRKPREGGGWDWTTKGVRKVLYRLPELLKADPAEIVFIPEGEKDADNLVRLGFTATTNVGGAGKWRAEHNEALRGRLVVIIPDNDQPGRDHAESVARNLVGVAASVKMVALPGLPEKGDVSDWLAAGGTVEELRRLVDATAEWEPTSNSTAAGRPDEKPEKEAIIKLLADAICIADHFAQDAGGKLYRYHEGVYKGKAESYVKAAVKSWLLEWDKAGKWSTRLASEVVEFIRVDAPQLWERPRLDVLNVTNGLLRLADRVLLPHTPKHLSAVQLPVIYDLAATCPNTESFVAQTFPADAATLAWEIPAWLMLPNVGIQKAVLLTGEGANGKSTWLNVVVVFLGKGNVASVSLHKLESDKFAVARLIGKLANVCPDLPSNHLQSTSTFKALTGGDTLVAEYKFRDSFDFTPFARLVFSANHPPQSQDGSHAFFRRWLVIPFDRTFEPHEQIPRDVLDGMLTTPAELSGLLNKALDALVGLTDRGAFSEPQSVREAWREFHATTDPLAVWLDQWTVDEPDAAVPCDQLLGAYNAAAQRAGRPAMNKTAFGLAVVRHRPAVDRKQRTINGRLQGCYLGIGMASAVGD